MVLPADPSANVTGVGARNAEIQCAQQLNASQSDAPSCNELWMQVLDRAQAVEGLPAIAVPSGFYSLPPFEQLFVLVDEERVDRGLPAIPALVAGLSADALAGAQSSTDPALTPSQAQAFVNYASFGNWASSYATAGTVYAWMYDDGPGGTNVECTTTNAAGCWGHRNNILAEMAPAGLAPLMGAASVPVRVDGAFDMESDTMLTAFVGPSVIGSLEAAGQVQYTWAEAVADGA